MQKPLSYTPSEGCEIHPSPAQGFVLRRRLKVTSQTSTFPLLKISWTTIFGWVQSFTISRCPLQLCVAMSPNFFPMKCKQKLRAVWDFWTVSLKGRYLPFFFLHFIVPPGRQFDGQSTNSHFGPWERGPPPEMIKQKSGKSLISVDHVPAILVCK